MEFSQLEIRTYEIKELEILTGIRRIDKGSHFKRDLCNTLTHWGYSYIWDSKNKTVIIISRPETPTARLTEILERSPIKVDTEKHTYSFAAFLFCLYYNCDNFLTKPRNTQVLYLENAFGIEEDSISLSTMDKWKTQLKRNGVNILRTPNSTHWKTLKNGKQVELTKEEINQLKQYYSDLGRVALQYRKDYPSLSNSEIQELAIKSLYNKYNGYWYPIKNIVINGWPPFITNIIDLIKEVVETKERDKTIIRQGE